MPTKKVVKKTIEDEAQEVLDAALHNIKVQEAARILTELSNLKADYERQKSKLEEQLAGVDSIRINSYGANHAEGSTGSSRW